MNKDELAAMAEIGSALKDMNGLLTRVVTGVEGLRAGQAVGGPLMAMLNLLLKDTGLITVDAGGHILGVSDTAQHISGYPEAELLNQTVECLVPARARDAHPNLREQYMKHPTAREMGARLDLTMLRKDGTEIPVQIALLPIGDGNGGHIVQVAVKEKIG